MAAAGFPSLQQRDVKWADTVTLWALVLEDVPYDLGERAMIDVLKKSRFFPAPAEVREAAIARHHREGRERTEIDEQVQKEIDDAWYEANREQIDEQRLKAKMLFLTGAKALRSPVK